MSNDIERITEIAEANGITTTYGNPVRHTPKQLLAFSQAIREDELASFATHRRDEIAEANAQHEAILAKRDEKHAKEIARLKSVPMKYRRMEFNAQLQKEIDNLKAQLAMQADALKELLTEAKYQSVKGGWDERYELEKATNALNATSEDVAKYKAEITAPFQAKIDALMLEYCPDEMTDEQIENWGASQIQVEV